MTVRNMTPEQFAKHIEKSIRRMADNLGDVVENNAKRIQRDAKSYIGEYQGPVGPYPAWEKLDPGTVEAKNGLHNPLIDSGELQNSIVVIDKGLSATVGSTSEHAEYQELGTVHIPARSFLGRAAYVNAEPLAHDVADELIKTIMTASK